MGKMQLTNGSVDENHLENCTESSAHANSLATRNKCLNSSNDSVKETTSANGHSNVKSHINESSSANGYNYPMRARISKPTDDENTKLVNGTVNKDNCQVSAENLMLNGKPATDNNNNEPSKISSTIPTFNCSSNGQNPDDDFISIGKRGRKLKPKKQSDKSPHGQNIKAKNQDNRNDEDSRRKVLPPANVAQKSPNKSFPVNGTARLTFAEVLANGLNGCTQSKDYFSNNNNLTTASVSDAGISADLSKNCTNDNKMNTSCKQNTSPTSVKMADVSSKNSKLECTDSASSKQNNELTILEMAGVSTQTGLNSKNEDASSQKGCLSSITTDSASCKQNSESTQVKMADVSAQTDLHSKNEDPSSQRVHIPFINADSTSCKQNSDSRKDEMPGVSAQTDLHSENEISASKNVCLSSIDEVENPCLAIGGIEGQEIDNAAINGIEAQEIDNSSYAAHCLSAVPDDGGRGDTEIYYNECRPYCCLVRREVSPMLIGKGGSMKRTIENYSGIKFWIHPHDYRSDLNIVQITGTGAQIEKAKEFIKERFNDVTLDQYLGPNPEKPVLSENYYPTLPEGTDFMGVASCIYDPHFFWLQQYGHPQFHALEDLEKRMTNHFNSVTDAPGVENPVIDSVVAVPGVRVGGHVKWIRGAIVNTFPDRGEIVVRYLDHGGDHLVPVNNIRPMRHEFFTIPFFAAQCCLNDILPAGEIWSDEARAEFTRLCNGFYPPVVRVICKTPQFYYVAMTAFDSETQMHVDVAVHLITKGFGIRPPLPATNFSNEHLH